MKQKWKQKYEVRMPRRPAAPSPPLDRKLEVISRIRAGATQKSVSTEFRIKIHVVGKIWREREAIETEERERKEALEKKEEAQKDSTEKEILGAGGTFIKNDIGSTSPKRLPSRPKTPDASTKPVRSRTNTGPGAESPSRSAGTGSPQLSITKLKDEGYESPRSSLLKRSHSNPNISQVFSCHALV